jgi:hypothetical protein
MAQVVSGSEVWVAAELRSDQSSFTDDFGHQRSSAAGSDVLTLRGFFEASPFFVDPGSDLDWSADTDHNRAVLTYVGEPEAVLAATQALCLEAFAAIDMRTHEGAHPRMGAVDVIPFVPLRGVSTDEAVALA